MHACPDTHTHTQTCRRKSEREVKSERERERERAGAEHIYMHVCRTFKKLIDIFGERTFCLILYAKQQRAVTHTHTYSYCVSVRIHTYVNVAPTDNNDVKMLNIFLCRFFSCQIPFGKKRKMIINTGRRYKICAQKLLSIASCLTVKIIKKVKQYYIIISAKV